MLVLAVAALGIAAAFGLSLVLKLRSIRRRGFGEGTRLSLPGAGLEMRYPHWWKAVGEEGHGRMRDASSGDSMGTAPSVGVGAPRSDAVVLRTGHSRGILRIMAWEESAPVDETSLRGRLTLLLREQGLELDDPEITTARTHPPRPATSGPDGPPPGASPGSPSGLRVWVASGGRRVSRPEERTYFELHLLALGGARVLFSYTNSVLQGFLDAYYLEKVLETLQPARFPR